MSGGSKQTTQQTQTNTIDPVQMAMYQANYAEAQKNAANLVSPYAGPLTAGFTPTQLQAQQYLTNLAGNTSYLDTINGATTATQNILANPVNGTVTANPVTAAQLAGTDLSAYLNPYQSGVIDASINQNERARQIAQNQINMQNSAGSAFGGSRSGVSNALTNEAYDRNNQANIANLNAQNFSQAQQAALADIAARNQIGQFNSSQNLTAQQQSIQNALAAQGLGLNAAGQMAQLSNNAFNLAAQQGGILGAVGDTQQQQQQAEMDANYQNWQYQKQLIMNQQNLLNASLGLIPVQQTSTSPGFTDILNSLGNAASGAASLWAASDVRTKSDVRTLGHDARGRRWVSFRYNWEPAGTVRKGVIAQEILHSDPCAVRLGDDGIYRVDYSQLQ
jgi:hypothetical protein